MNTLIKKRAILNAINNAIEKRERKLANLIDKRELLSENASPDKYRIIQNQINNLETNIDRLIIQRNGIEADLKKKGQLENEIKKGEKRKETFNLNEILNILTRKSKDNILTYDDLYETVPADIASADLIDEIRNLLNNKNIKVLDKINKIDETRQYLNKIDEEIIEYERNIELQIKALFQGSYEKIDKNENISESPVTLDTSGKIATELSGVVVRVPPPNIPQIKDVTPELTNNISSLLVSKLKGGAKEKKRAFLTQVENIEQNIFSGQKTDLEYNDISSYKGEKIYSKTRFDNDRRLSLYAKTVGDRAEEIVIKFLKETLLPNEKTTIRWISKAGETPGWDISYLNEHNQLIAIEVKGTTGDSFPNLEITANEWKAANELRERYWIYLVTGSFGTNPKIQCLQNPVKLKESGILHVTPILWRVEMISQ